MNIHIHVMKRSAIIQTDNSMFSLWVD